MSKLLKNLAIVAGVILLALLVGKVTGQLNLVLDILMAIGLILVAISILVTIHELGHFLAAKAFGMRVETFSIGFPPKIYSVTKGDTEYQIGAVPLGGYVKISGMIDESLDTEHLNAEPQPWEFRAKPVWQRLIVMVAGVVMNIILGVAIFSMMKFVYGEEKLPMDQVQYGLEVVEGNDSVTTLGYFLGFRTGDELVSFRGEQFEYFDDYARQNILLDDDAYFEVDREGTIMRIDIPGNIQNYFANDSVIPEMFFPNMPAVISVADSSPASSAGIRDEDHIIMIDSQDISYFSDLRSALRDKADQTVQVTLIRHEEEMTLAVDLDDRAILGVGRNWEAVFEMEKIPYGFFGAISAGSKQAFGFLSANVKGFRNLARPGVDVSKSVMGPIKIAKAYLDIFKRNGLKGLIQLTGMLSMILAFVNILPIPALDGGHVVFLLVELITRKEPSAKIKIIAQQIGMVIIVGLMIVILFNDVIGLI